MKKSIALLLAVAMLLTVTACSSVASDEKTEAVETSPASTESASASEEAVSDSSWLDDFEGMTMNMSISYPSASPVIPVFEYFCSEINARTEGKITINLFTSGQLVASADTYTALVNGSLDIGESDPANTKSFFPLMTGTALSGIIYNSSKVNTYALYDLYTNSGWEETKPLKFLFICGQTSANLLMNERIDTLEDFSGKTIRGSGFGIEVLKTLGAAAVGIPASECYEALMKNTIDGVLMPFDVLAQANWSEVLSYGITCPGMCTGHHYVAMNLDKWNSLPEEAQQIINDVSMECMDQIAPMWDDLCAEGIKIGTEQGMEFYTISDEEMARWMECVTALQDEWVEETTANGYDAAAALELIKSTVEKYNNMYS